jgi:penicillin G amidase
VVVLLAVASTGGVSNSESAGSGRFRSAQDPNLITLPGLAAPAAVRRDDRGIAYVDAANASDLFLVQGYVTASDRLWQMDLLRRSARGELSEIFGRATLEEDKRHRRFGFARLAAEQAKSLRPELRGPLEAFARGVNAYIASCDEKTSPAEFRTLRYKPRPWSPADSLVIGKLVGEMLSTSWRTDVMRAALAGVPGPKRQELFPEESPLDVLVVGDDGGSARPGSARTLAPAPIPVDEWQKLLRLAGVDADLEQRTFGRIGMFAEGRAASNNWVVSGRHTATGKPILANDPHLAPSAPSIWYMIHLSAPGLRVAGVTFPGTPGVMLGHNERIAWGATNLGPDVQDLFLERFDPDNPRRYKVPGGWEEAEVRREEILVRKNPLDPATESIPLEVTVTRHGPIILERGEGAHAERFALRWTILDRNADQVEAFLGISRARNWTEFRNALREYPGPTQNFVYADVDGHIGYYGAGRIPTRRSGDGSVPCDGATGEGEWTGFIAFDQLPHVLDPPSGVIVTANSRVIGRSYPHFLTREWSEPYRARRIRDLLERKPKLTVDDIRTIQADVFSIAGSSFAKEIAGIPHTANPAEDREWGTFVEAAGNWDGRVTGDSKTALIVAEMRTAFRTRLVKTALGDSLAAEYRWMNAGTFLDRVLRDKPHGWLPDSSPDYGALLRTCWQDARAALAQRYGSDELKWVWGASNLARWWRHPLVDAPLIGAQFKIPQFNADGSGGSIATVNVGPSVSMRLIADTSDWDRSVQGLAPGNSGDPASSHFKDQLDDWRHVAQRPFPFTRQAVELATRVAWRLQP